MSMCTRRCRASTAELCGDSNSRWKSAGVRYAEPSAGAARSKSCVAPRRRRCRPCRGRASCCAAARARRRGSPRARFARCRRTTPSPSCCTATPACRSAGGASAPCTAAASCQPARRPPSSFAPSCRRAPSSLRGRPPPSRALELGRRQVLVLGRVVPSHPELHGGGMGSVLGKGGGGAGHGVGRGVTTRCAFGWGKERAWRAGGGAAGRRAGRRRRRAVPPARRPQPSRPACAPSGSHPSRCNG